MKRLPPHHPTGKKTLKSILERVLQYIVIQNADYELLKDNMTFYDYGIHFLFKGYNLKPRLSW